MPEILFEYSAWWLVLIALLSVVGAGALYRRDKSLNRNVRLILGTLRFSIFFLLGLLLLSPLLKSSRSISEKPILLWLQDQSSSVWQSADSGEVARHYQTSLEEQLGERYELKTISFAADTEGDSLDPSLTDISGALQYARERYYNQNLAAIVLSSDGIYNRGGNPVYEGLAGQAPVFSLGLGDTSQAKDLALDKVVHNKVSYSGNRFPVEVYLSADQLPGEESQLSLFDDNGKLLASERITINREKYFEQIEFELEAGEPGLRVFRLQAEPVEGELQVQNNRLSFAVEILESKKKIVIVAQAPHPDMAALKLALESSERYQVQSYIAKSLPAERETADLVILHQADARLSKTWLELGTPIWWIGDDQAIDQSLNSLLKLSLPKGGGEEVLASVNEGFTAFSFNEDFPAWVEELPPLTSPYGELQGAGNLQVLMQRKIGEVITDQPLWFFRSDLSGDRREAYTLGTGIWQWRIHDYRTNGDFQNFDGLISQCVQYLTTKRQQERLQINMPEQLRSGEALRAEARLFNASMELVNEPSLQVVFMDENGQEFSQQFNPQGKRYTLRSGGLPEGNYRWTAFATLGEERFSRTGNLLVADNDLESRDLQARHDILRKLSKQSGGKFFHLQEKSQLWPRLAELESARTIQRLESTTRSILELRWLFFLLLAIATAEWVLRKYFGNY